MVNQSDWPGGVVHESLDVWIDRQPWTAVGKSEAKRIAADTKWAINRHVWAKMAIANKWVDTREPMNDEGCSPRGGANSPT